MNLNSQKSVSSYKTPVASQVAFIEANACNNPKTCMAISPYLCTIASNGSPIEAEAMNNVNAPGCHDNENRFRLPDEGSVGL